MANKRIYLGGTCNESNWKNRLISYLDKDTFSWFDPVVDDWDGEARTNELCERAMCDFCVCTITPKMTGCYAVAEVVDDSNKRPEKTVFVLLKSDDGFHFTEGQRRSFAAVANIVSKNGGRVFDNLKSAAIWMAS